MKTSYYRSLKSLIIVVIAALFGLVQIVSASPIGTDYGAYLYIPLQSPLEAEEYENDPEEPFTFDGTPAELPIVSGPGISLRITDSYSQNSSNGSDTITITIFGANGAALTDNTIDGDAELELSFSGTFWEEVAADAATDQNIIDFNISVLFSSENPIDVDFDFADIGGDGTPSNPLAYAFTIFDGELTQTEGLNLNASDLMLEMDIQPVPIPGTLLLMISGLIGVFAIRKKARGDNFNRT